jgi:hypothetical protein
MVNPRRLGNNAPTDHQGVKLAIDAAVEDTQPSCMAQIDAAIHARWPMSSGTVY